MLLGDTRYWLAFDRHDDGSMCAQWCSVFATAPSSASSPAYALCGLLRLLFYLWLEVGVDRFSHIRPRDWYRLAIRHSGAHALLGYALTDTINFEGTRENAILRFELYRQPVLRFDAPNLAPLLVQGVDGDFGCRLYGESRSTLTLRFFLERAQ